MASSIEFFLLFGIGIIRSPRNAVYSFGILGVLLCPSKKNKAMRPKILCKLRSTFFIRLRNAFFGRLDC